MSLIKKNLSNQNGMVTVIAMVVVVAVTALAVTLMNLSGSELDMAFSEKAQEQSFHEGDSCLWVTAKFLSHLNRLYGEGIYGIPEGDPIAPGIRYPDGVTSDQFYQLYIQQDEPYPFYQEDPDTGEQKFIFSDSLGFDETRLPAVADIRTQDEEGVEGNASNQIAAGYDSGIGLGGAGSGGYQEIFIFACEGRGMTEDNPRAQRRVYGRYRWIPVIAGGL